MSRHSDVIREKELADIIIQQMRCTVTDDGTHGTVALMSWGFSHPRALKAGKDSLGGVRFNVDGLVYSGDVEVRLHPRDTYDVFLQDERGEMTRVAEDVYFDMLVGSIDLLVEKQDEEVSDE